MNTAELTSRIGENSRNILQQIYRFLGLSGMGWLLDFATLCILGAVFDNLFLVSVTSSLVGASFVFFMSPRFLFDDNHNLPLKVKYAIYIGYQLLLILLISVLLVRMDSLLTSYIVPTLPILSQVTYVLAKIIVTPFAMVCNFMVLRYLMEKIKFSLDNKNKDFKLKIETIFLIAITIIHFLSSFIIEKWFLRDVDLATTRFSITGAYIRSNVYSDNFESSLNYSLSKLWCLLLIIGFWLLIVKIYKYFCNDIKNNKTLLIYLIIFVVLTLGNVFLYPNNFMLEIDNFLCILLVVNQIPLYWHSIYTSSFYTGVLMTFGHPICIGIVQTCFFVYVMYYIHKKLQIVFRVNRLAYINLGVLLLPSSYFLLENPYRGSFCAILVVYYMTYIMFSVFENREISNFDIIKTAILSSFIANYRAEMIILLLFLIPYLVKVKYLNKIICFLAVFLLTFTFFQLPQKVAKDKYDGEDYMIMNTMFPLYSIFNSPTANLTYDSADNDLNDINNVVPIAAIKQSASFRGYHYSLGRRSFNQTLATDDAAKKYISAYRNIVTHNLSLYLGVQCKLLGDSLGLSDVVSNSSFCKIYQYQGKKRNPKYDYFVYDSWRHGLEMIINESVTHSLLAWPVHQYLSERLVKFINGCRQAYSSYSLVKITNILSLFLTFASGCWFGVKVIQNNTLSDFTLCVIPFSIIGLLSGIFLFMPEGRPAYVYPVIHLAYAYLFIVMCAKLSRHEL